MNLSCTLGLTVFLKFTYRTSSLVVVNDSGNGMLLVMATIGKKEFLFHQRAITVLQDKVIVRDIILT